MLKREAECPRMVRDSDRPYLDTGGEKQVFLENVSETVRKCMNRSLHKKSVVLNLPIAANTILQVFGW